MVVHPVNYEVREPRIGSAGLEQLIEELEAVLAKVVAEDLETHKRLVLGQSLSKQGESHVVHLVVSHVQMDKRLVHRYGLSDGLGSIVTALVVGQVKGLQTAVVRLEVFGDGLATSEAYFVGVEV